ncbi:MAG: hypothetical protein WB699_10440 [Bacteroidota bacterium]
MGKEQTKFQELYQRYASDVFRFSFWLSGDPEVAKDITAETFIRVRTSDSETRMDSVTAYLLERLGERRRFTGKFFTELMFC